MGRCDGHHAAINCGIRVRVACFRSHFPGRMHRISTYTYLISCPDLKTSLFLWGASSVVVEVVGCLMAVRTGTTCPFPWLASRFAPLSCSSKHGAVGLSLACIYTGPGALHLESNGVVECDISCRFAYWACRSIGALLRRTRCRLHPCCLEGFGRADEEPQ